MNAPLFASQISLPKTPVSSWSHAPHHQAVGDKAQAFVRQVAHLHKRFQRADRTVDLVTEEKHMIFLAEGLLLKQEEFRRQCKPISVEVAFHYTRSDSIQSISNQGLLPSPGKRRHGKYFGSGVYLGNNPHAFACYGDAGLVCLIVKGGLKQMYSGDDGIDQSVDCLQGNKLAAKESTSFANPTSPYYDEIIVRTKDQVLPLLSYPRSLVNNTELLWDLQTSMQHLVDRSFNDERRTILTRIFPDYRDLLFERKLMNHFKVQFLTHDSQAHSHFRAIFAKLSQASHTPTRKKKPSNDVTLCFPPALKRGDSAQSYTPLFFPPAADCPICLISLREPKAVTIMKCHHAFHESCLEQSLKKSNTCPTCRVVLGEPSGSCPSGMLTVTREKNVHCRGFETVPTLHLEYSIPVGTQSELHEKPGHPFTGTKRKAYLPDTREGRELLQRLRYAFSRGLTFTVGTSLTTGQSSTVVWTSIHHKTVLGGGPHGFPDPGYFLNCNEELDALGVPKACDL